MSVDDYAPQWFVIQKDTWGLESNICIGNHNAKMKGEGQNYRKKIKQYKMGPWQDNIV